MRRNLFVTALGGFALLALYAPACGGSGSGSGFGGDGGNSSSGASSGGGSGGSSGTGSGSGSCGLAGCSNSSSGASSSGGNDAGPACPTGLNCNPGCGGGTTSISGKVYDPGLNDGLYDVAVYVPEKALGPLPKGVPTGADACNCGALFKSGAYVSTATGVDGTFKLAGVPTGNVPLVLQIGKWRREVMINVKGCQDNPQADKTLSLPGTLAGAGPNDNMPDIAVSTGSADTLECLMQRIGIPASEYGMGATGTGHVHIFSGGDSTGACTSGACGTPNPGWQSAPASYTNLWDSQAHMMPFDITLLSCEGGETFKANPQVLESYLNAGGRVFSSHYHYAFFTNPTESMQSYAPPADWGNNLASWTPGSNQNGAVLGTVDQTLNNGGGTFAKGVALYKWLGLNGALQNMLLPIDPSRFNAVVGPANKPSQPWVTDIPDHETMYFSFDTPVNAPPAPDGGAPNYCGRAVFSDMHVAGNNLDPSPSCRMSMLSPQEKALEFMLFDLSACVLSDTVPPSDAGVPIVQ